MSHYRSKSRACIPAVEKIGAGGGGCLFFLAAPDDVAAVRETLADGNARLLDFQIETTGLDVTRE